MKKLLLLALLTSACASTPPRGASEPIPLDGVARTLDGTRYRQTRVGRLIAAPPEVVWSLLTTVDGFTDWNSTLVSLKGDIRLDGEVQLVAKTDPDRTFELRVSTFEAPHRMVWEDGGAMFRGVRVFELQASGAGTAFRMKETFTGAMMGFISSDLPDFRPSFTQFAADLEAAALARGAP